MEIEYKQLFEVIVKFRKLHLSTLLPNIAHSEYMTMRAVSCLAEKSEEEGVSVSKIAKEMTVPAAAVSRSIRQLEEKGYIIRSVNQKDRRNTYVSLTPTGRKVLQEADMILTDLARNVLDNMGADNVKQLNSYLIQFYETVREEMEKRKYMNGKDA